MGIMALVALYVIYMLVVPKTPPRPLHAPGVTNAPQVMVAAADDTQAVPVAMPVATEDTDVFPAVALAVPASTTLKSFVLSNELVAYTFSSFGGDLASIELARTPLVLKGPIRLSCAESNAWEVPLRIRSAGTSDVNTLTMAPAKVADGELTLTGVLDSAVQVTKRYTLDTNYLLRTEFTFQNIGKAALAASNQWTVWLGRIDHATTIQEMRGCDISVVQDGMPRILRKDPGKKDVRSVVPGPVQWLDVRNKYFAFILAPETTAVAAAVSSIGANDNRQMSAFAVFDLPALAPGATYSWRATLFAGPKAYELLHALPSRIGYGGDYTGIINFGWFSVIAKPIMIYGLKGINSRVHNYGIAIIILTIIVRVLTWPLQTKSYRSMQEMQKVAPELQKLKEKLKDDPSRLQQEQMLLYRKHGINPLGGCLPMLLQFPIFVALYQALWNAVELWGASFLWIKDLSLPDTIAHLPFMIPFLGNGVNLLPLLMTGATIGQQVMTPTTGDKQQQQMMYLMPVMFLFIFYNMPSGLVLYWFVSQLIGMGQTFYLHYLKKQEAERRGNALGR